MNIFIEVGILFFTRTSQKPQSTTLPRFTSALTHNRSTISGATNHTDGQYQRGEREPTPRGQQGS